MAGLPATETRSLPAQHPERGADAEPLVRQPWTHALCMHLCGRAALHLQDLAAVLLTNPRMLSRHAKEQAQHQQFPMHAGFDQPPAGGIAALSQMGYNVPASEQPAAAAAAAPAADGFSSGFSSAPPMMGVATGGRHPVLQ